MFLFPSSHFHGNQQRRFRFLVHSGAKRNHHRGGAKQQEASVSLKEAESVLGWVSRIPEASVASEGFQAMCSCSTGLRQPPSSSRLQSPVKTTSRTLRASTASSCVCFTYLPHSVCSSIGLQVIPGCNPQDWEVKTYRGLSDNTEKVTFNNRHCPLSVSSSAFTCELVNIWYKSVKQTFSLKNASGFLVLVPSPGKWAGLRQEDF